MTINECFGSTEDWLEVNALVGFSNNKVKFKDIKKGSLLGSLDGERMLELFE